MYEKSAFVFWVTLILYIATLLTVSYVGVYLTYIAIPLIVISGLVMKFSQPKQETQKTIATVANSTAEVLNATTGILEDFNSFLQDEINEPLALYNKKQTLISERTKKYLDKIHELKIQKIPLEVKLRYTKTNEEMDGYNNQVNLIDIKILELENKIEAIKEECELEVIGNNNST